MVKVVKTEQAPGAIGPYSQGIDLGQLVFFSGQIALDPATGEMAEPTIEAQTRRVLDNVKALLESVGLGFENVVKTTVFLDDINDFAAMNAIYAEYFVEPYPARSAVGVAKLPRGALVEIEVIAAR
ncbi:MAG: RidA family protein [Erysipelotrichaceae bacterium]|nr:RidA family protein [Erysipelotrichaceae bacterium]